MKKDNKNKALGRGLSALMGDITRENLSGTVDSQSSGRLIPIEKLIPNPDQPRQLFDSVKLKELAESLKTHGIIQPLIVRKHPTNSGKYEIVAGERRWRAAQIAKLFEIPVIIRDFDDTEVLEVAIIENVQRSDLNPIDEARGFSQLMNKFGHTQEQVATALGKSRSHIANTTRLLNLPDDVISYISEGKLSAGHARALIGNPQSTDLARKIIKQGLSVRQAEKLVKTQRSRGSGGSGKSKTKDADTVMLERELSASLGVKATIDHTNGKDSGRLVLHYKNLTQLDDLMRVLSGG